MFLDKSLVCEEKFNFFRKLNNSSLLCTFPNVAFLFAVLK